MVLEQDVTGCMAEGIGAHGVSAAELDARLARAEEGLDALRRHHAQGTLPLLRLPERQDDLAGIRELADRLRSGATDVVLLGTGGSSLGGQALAQVGGWNVPGLPADAAGLRLHFFDNLDPNSMAAAVEELPLRSTRILAVSKSGGTAETMMQLLVFLEALRRRRPEADVGAHVFGLTEPAKGGRENTLRRFLKSFGCTIHDHDPGVGGRYSALSNVGLVPAALMGLDPATIRKGAASVLEPVLSGASAREVEPALGAALVVALQEARGVNISVLWGYSDRLERLTRWYVQLWAESLGKEGKGSTPVAAVGPVDQHSQQQLYLGGPADKLVTMIQTQTRGRGPRIDPDLAREADQEGFAGRTVGDLVDAMQRATAETLIRNGRPTRLLRIGMLDAEAIGALMMHFFLETILAGHMMGVDPFDQPAVEESKVLARDYLAAM